MSVPIQHVGTGWSGVLGPKTGMQFCTNQLDFMKDTNMQQDKLQALLVEVVNLERRHASNSRGRKIASRLQPLVAFVERYASAVDASLQGCPNPASVIWGLLRSLLVVARSYTQYFDRVVSTLEELGLVVSVYSQYEDLVDQDCAFRQCLSLVYNDIICFLLRSRKVFQKSGIVVLFQSVWRSFETEFQDVLASLSIHTSALRDQTTVSYRSGLYELVRSQTVQTLEAVNTIVSSPIPTQRDNILKWLAPIPVHRRLAQEHAKKLLPSGQWLLKTSEYLSWRGRSGERFLWINAPLGSGKTVLSTTIIHDLYGTLSSSELLGYFFCDRTKPSDCVSHKVLSTLLHQILDRSSAIAPSIVESYLRDTRSGCKELSQAGNALDLLQQAITQLGYVYFVIDGLDGSPHAQELTRAISELIQSTQNCSFLVLSRDVSSIRHSIPESSSELRITEANTEDDLDAFISLSVRRLGMSWSDPALEMHIRQKLQMECRGRFLWASHMVHSLESALRPHETHQALSQLPVGLEDDYVGELRRLLTKNVQQREIFTHAARWILCSLQPLSAVDITTALAIDTSRREFDAAQKPFVEVLKDSLSPFFELGSYDDIVRPIHPSVTDFLLNSASVARMDNTVGQLCVDFTRDHRLLGQECLLLLTHTFASAQSGHSAADETLTRYACFNWPEHIIKTTQDDLSRRDVLNFLNSNYRREWLFHYLDWRKSMFPLQRLFYLQSCVQTWLSHKHSKLPRYLDWVPDISAMLLESFQTRPFSHLQNSTRRQTNPTRGEETWSHFERMMVVRDLSRHLTATKNLLVAVDLFERTLHEKQAVGNTSSSEMTWLLNTLGILYDQLGQIDHATRTQERALALLSEREHPDVSQSNWTRNELGRMYRHQGRFEDAVKMHEEALAVLNGATQDESTDLEIAWTLSTMARVYRKQRRFDEAIIHTQRALEIRRLVQGEDHPHCLWLLSDIAQCYHERGDISAAAQYHRDVYDGRRRSLGPQHPDTLWTMNNLALTLAKMGSMYKDEALLLQRSAWTSQCEILGVRHPHTKWTAAMIDAMAVGGNVGGVMFGV